jgi:2-haloacid dehalogenase
MTDGKFKNIRACVFDAYGTLFDVHSAVGKHRSRMGDKADGLSALWRTKQLEYTWLRSLMGEYTDFWQVTQDGLDFSLETLGIDDSSLRQDLLQAYLELSTYPEVIPVLTRLREAGMQTAILTNGSPDMIEAAVNHSGIGDLLDACLSVEDVGIFKPDPRVYQHAVDRLGVAASSISFQSSNAWDAAGASNFGMTVVWVNRFGQRVERLPGRSDAELTDLSELPNIVAG